MFGHAGGLQNRKKIYRNLPTCRGTLIRVVISAYIDIHSPAWEVLVTAFTYVSIASDRPLSQGPRAASGQHGQRYSLSEMGDIADTSRNARR